MTEFEFDIEIVEIPFNRSGVASLNNGGPMSIAGMKNMTVKAKKDKLLEILSANLEKHVAEYDKVVEAYRKVAMEELQKRLAEFETAPADKLPTLDFLNPGNQRYQLQRPACHADDYRRTISMLELHDDEHIILDSQAYLKFVEDNWDWKHSFSTLSNTYGVGAAAL